MFNFRNRGSGDRDDVARKWMLRLEVGLVSQFGVLVPLRGKDAFPANCLEAAPQPTNARKEVDEFERLLVESIGRRLITRSVKGIESRRPRLA